ncbi:class II glutamine amidotransferase [Methylobacter marinus]|uniref:class II glutamine amidotransferase n=1 Tax=Methylobacter marinus TaxID=34058 RepID=UPI00036242D0|nr:class II glutamine amidotransferase [Methylobacter marinus]
MCELLGMSANVPTDICFSFTGLMHRGGRTGPHRDGWGITFYEDRGFRTFKDPMPCHQSPIARLVQDVPIKSRAVIGHIRQANRGHVALENTHPFTREQWGSFWTFAHNGQLSGYEERLMPGKHRPVGDTDSEAAFCWLLNELDQKYPRKPANMKAMFQYAGELCSRLNDFGICNMLLSDGRYLLAYCSTSLHWITRRAPFGKARLIDEDVVIDFHQETTPHDIVTVIATLPLTRDEQWRAISPRHYRLFHYGECIAEQDI